MENPLAAIIGKAGLVIADGPIDTVVNTWVAQGYLTADLNSVSPDTATWLEQHQATVTKYGLQFLAQVLVGMALGAITGAPEPPKAAP